MKVGIEITNGVAILTIDNPPVNVIGLEVRQGLLTALDRIATENIKRIIITGAGRSFVAGADATEFSASPQQPHLPEILARLSALPIPVIAAINGTALGGGLELALACHYRIAAPNATLGLPEVQLGVVPGAGGTQLLPRLIGIGKALPLIAEGKVLSAPEARKLGIVDALADDPLQAAIALSAETLAGHPPIHRLPAPEAAPETEAAVRSGIARRMNGQIAPRRAVDLVTASAILPLSEGLKQERETFLELRNSGQARALRHVFFAERAAMKQGRAMKAAPRHIDTAILIGGGHMGASIAYALVQAGIAVTILETNAEAMIRAVANVSKLYDDAIRRGKITAETAEREQTERFSFVTAYEDLPPAEIAIEAAFENMEVKQAIFASLSAVLPETTVIATNTSYLDIDAIARNIRHPERIVGLHFFSPAHVMKLLEVVKARHTSPETFATAFRLAERMKKIPVLSGICDGFIGNRILTYYRHNCDIMLQEGALPWEVDAAMQVFGMAMGPYAVQDLSGLDIAYASRRRRKAENRSEARYIHIADRIVEDLKRLGRKSGAGWYDYPEGASRQPSADVETLILDTARRENTRRRIFDQTEIIDRAVTAMIAEGFRILEEGIATKPSDIDLVMIHGYAFPRWQGGVMHHADEIGLPVLLERMERYAAEDPRTWAAPELLRRLVAERRPLSSLNHNLFI